MKRVNWVTAGLGLLVLLSGVGCAPSEEEIQQEFAAFVDGLNHCQEARECVLVAPGCPLGCHLAVPATSQQRVENKARELIDDYAGSGASCQYGCAEAGEIACVEGRCTTQ